MDSVKVLSNDNDNENREQSRHMTNNQHLGPYELRGELGRGAMAKVWRGFDPKLEREVAIKEPLFDERLSQDVLDEMSVRFVKEGKAAARLNHPGIVTIYGADIYDGRPAIIMELIEGVTLDKLLEQGSLSPNNTLDILDQLLDAVGYAHSQGVIHRDIKPENIFITTDGRVKLADFGIAHIEDSSLTKKTQVGTVLGTPGYMAPEQATGSGIDKRTDLFSIGTIAYEMVTGNNPFGEGDSTTLLYRIVHEPVDPLPDITTKGLPTDIRPAILSALNKDPNDRPQDAASFKEMLHGATAPKSNSTAKKSSSTKTKWIPVVIGAIGLVVLGVVFFFATSGGSGGVVDSEVSTSVKQEELPESVDGGMQDNERETTEEKEEVVETAKESALINLNNPEQYYQINVFLSNFTELGSVMEGYNISITDEDQIVTFVIRHDFLNSIDKLEIANYDLSGNEISEPGSSADSYVGRISNDRLQQLSRYFFNKDVSLSKISQYLVRDDYVYFGNPKDVWPKGIALSTDIRDISANQAEVSFMIYGEGYDCADQGIYHYTIDEIKENENNAISIYQGSGTAVVELVGNGADASYKLVSLSLSRS